MKKIFKAFFTVTSVSVVTRGISFIFKIFISRELCLGLGIWVSRGLGAGVMGVYQICFSVFAMFAALAAGGIPVTLSRITAETQALGDLKAQRSAVTTAMMISLMISMAVCTVFYSFPSLLDLLFSDARCRKLFLIILPTMIATSVSAVIRRWFWGGQIYFVFSL